MKKSPGRYLRRLQERERKRRDGKQRAVNAMPTTRLLQNRLGKRVSE